MNNSLSHLSPQRRSEVLQERFGLRVAVALTAYQTASPRHDIGERLRIAREQAIARARPAQRVQPAPAVVLAGGGTAALAGSDGDTDAPWWLRLSSLFPLALLLAGLFLIDHHYTQAKIAAAAEVDAALLADDLPPEAYRDPGFAEFLKTGRP